MRAPAFWGVDPRVSTNWQTIDGRPDSRVWIRFLRISRIAGTVARIGTGRGKPKSWIPGYPTDPVETSAEPRPPPLSTKSRMNRDEAPTGLSPIDLPLIILHKESMVF